MRTIVVVDYDPRWPETFERLRSTVWPVVRDVALGVEHVGSTAVPGLAAKPIIDVSVVVRAESDVPAAIERLATLGYVYRGNLGVEGRDAFDSPEGLPAHNLYLCPRNSPGLANHLAVRDHLRTHPDTAKEYGELKEELAKQFPHDIDGYVDGKTDLLLRILQAAGLPPARLAEIERANRGAMNNSAPTGWHTVTPRIVVEDPAGFVAFLRRVFGATGAFQEARPSEIQIGDSLLMVSGAGARETFPAFLYVYVDEVDATFQRALDAGAESLEAVWDTPYGDRRGMVKDRWGNVWQIAAPVAGPPGL
jgi:GrpB-like predicted nucleotidyltransferase (UPF0157 family)/uncharacterized glyoxalase superfamily protein PhnB